MEVTYYTTRICEDPNIKFVDCHAEVNGIHFLAMPFQPYIANCGKWVAKISCPIESDWHVYIYLENKLEEHVVFKKADDAFLYAVEKISG